MNGSRPRPPSSTVGTELPEGRRGPGRAGARAARGSPSKATSPSASVATGGRKRMHGAGVADVDRGGPGQRTRRHGPPRHCRGRSIADAQGRQPGDHERACRGPRSAPSTPGRTVGQPGQHQRPVGHRLRARHGHRAPHRASEPPAPARASTTPVSPAAARPAGSRGPAGRRGTGR